jgi:hypothetical protein
VSATSTVPPGGTLGKLVGEADANAAVERIVSGAAVNPMFLKTTLEAGGGTLSDVAADGGAEFATMNAAGPGWTVTVRGDESPLAQLWLEIARTTKQNVPACEGRVGTVRVGFSTRYCFSPVLQSPFG